MTVRIETVEPDVLRVHCRTLRGTAVGYDVSAYLMRGVLVDTGFARVRDEVMGAVRELSPRGAVVTHWHEDHAGNAPAFVAAGIPVCLHPRCEAILRERPHIALYRSLIWGATPPLTAPVVSFDPLPLEIIATPGHTADHQVVWDAERRILASGDLFLGVKVRVAHEQESPRQLLESLRRVAALEPRLLLDAHRGPLMNAVPLLRAKIGWMEETMGKMLALARAGADAREIRQRVLGSEDFVGRVSFGEYSKLAFVRGVLREDGKEA
jgi:ribonuclease/clavin/mitogillin